jgi:hypothetical protein
LPFFLPSQASGQSDHQFDHQFGEDRRKKAEKRRRTAESHPIPPRLALCVFASFFEGSSGNPKKTDFVHGMQEVSGSTPLSSTLQTRIT